MVKKITALLLLVCLFGFLLSHFQRNHVDKYDLRPIKRGVLVQTISALGQVDSTQHEAILSIIDATIVSINIKEGSLVSKKDTLFVLSSQEIENNILRLSEKENEAKISFLNTKYEQEYAKNEYSRALSSYKLNAIAGRELDEKKNKLEQCNQILGIKEKMLILAKQSLQKERARLIKGTLIYPPIAGLVTSLPNTIQKGAPIRSGEVLCDISTTGNLMVNAAFNEFDGKNIFIGQSAAIRGQVLGSNILHGTVSWVSPKVQNGKVAVKITMPTNNADLRIGHTVEAEIIVNKKENVLFVPIEAVSKKNGSSYVFLYKNKQLIEIPVTTGMSTIESLEILSDNLQSGQKVAIPNDDMKISK